MICYKNCTIYLGKSMETFNAIRGILQDNHIDYRYKIHNHDEALISPGQGVGRSIVGNVGNFNNNMYEILDTKANSETAKLLIRTLNGK